MHKLGILIVAALSLSPLVAKKSDESPFTLCISQRTGKIESTKIKSLVVARALYRQLDDEQRREMKDALEESVSRREARLNPLADDLEEDDPDARLERLFETAPATFGPARLLLSERFCASDGFCVRVTANACNAGEHLPQAREVGRARFLAWPYAHARRVNDSADALRREPNVGLVLDGAPSTEPHEQAVMSLIERREVLLRLEHRDEDGVDEAEVPLPWTPKSGEVLVVPTLEAVAANVAREH